MRKMVQLVEKRPPNRIKLVYLSQKMELYPNDTYSTTGNLTLAFRAQHSTRSFHGYLQVDP